SFPVIFSQLILRNVLSSEDRTQQGLLELLDRYLLRQKFRNIRHPAANRLDSFRLDLVAIHLKRGHDILHLGVKKQRAVAEHSSLGGILGVTGYFPFADLNVVASRQFSLYSHASQSLYD